MPMTTRCQAVGTPTRIRLLLAIVTRMTPRMVPITVPRPPVSWAPPKTTAAITLNSVPTRSCGLAWRAIEPKVIPAMPDSKPTKP